MQHQIIARAITAGIYCLILAGLVLAGKDSFRQLRHFIISRKRLRKPKKQGRGQTLTAANQLVLATTGLENKGGWLVALSVTLALFGVTISYGRMGAGGVLVAATIMGLTPALALRVKLEGIRGRGSKEGEWFVAELLSKYRMSGYNMDLCLESIVNGRTKESVCYDQCEVVLARMRAAGEKSMARCVEPMAYAIGTSWAKMLAYCIGQAATEGTDVSLGLEDILMQLREVRSLQEERNRLNSESGRLVLFMVPFTYALTIMFSIKYLGLTLSHLIHNQLGTAAGVMLLGGIGFMFLVNLLILNVAKAKRMDY